MFNGTKVFDLFAKKKKNFGIKEFTAKAKRIAPPAKDKELESSPPRHKITP